MLIAFVSFQRETRAQFYSELLSINQQHFLLDGNNANLVTNTAINALAPIVRPNGDIALMRASWEHLNIDQNSSGHKHWSFSMPIGYQWQSRRFSQMRWTALAIPKWAGGSDRSFSALEGWQYGCYALATWSKSQDLKYKAGVYINQEFFGTFIVPLLGIDWKVNERFQIFGTLPNSMKFFYQLKPNRWNIALLYRSMTRSFRNELPNHWVRYNEMEIKALLEFQMNQSVFFIDGGYFFGKSPRLYASSNPEEHINNPLYSGNSRFWIINAGYTFRLAPKKKTA